MSEEVSEGAEGDGKNKNPSDVENYVEKRDRNFDGEPENIREPYKTR